MRNNRTHTWLPIMGSLLLVMGLLWLSLHTLNAASASPDQATAPTQASPDIARAIDAPAATNWCAAGDFQGWNNNSTPAYDDGTNGDLVAGDGVYSVDYTIATAGRFQWKFVECGNWGNTHPSENAWAITSAADQVVKFTLDTNDHSSDAGIVAVPAQYSVNANDDIPTTWAAVGDWQGWDPGNLDTQLTYVGNGFYRLAYEIGTPGSYVGKVTNDGWNNQVGADGRSVNGPNLPIEVTADDSIVTFWLDGRQGRSGIFVTAPATVIPPIDLNLVRAPVSHTVQDEIFYFLLPDRYQNGDAGNDTGGVSGTALDHGFLPSHKNYYHGGDLAGLAMTDTLDYLQNLGVSALWITPVFENDVLEGDGTDIENTYAAYHGYWIINYENVDPHLGTDQEFMDFVDAAHARGIKVYLDIVANHTGNLISYLEGQSSYRNKTDYPYLDANGDPFDDQDYAGTGTFPPLDPAISFPYTPITNGVKSPTWLNNPIYYHNRGDSSFAGESSNYGDFYGLDDLFTEHPDVVTGFIDIFTNTISTYNIDGFRLDTVKHVNIEFWEQVVPAVMDYATTNGKPDFFMFGEVFEYSTPYLSTFTTQGGLPSILDFQTQGYAYGFAINSEATDNLQAHFANDDYYTDADSNAYQLANFISNHDIGRFGGFMVNNEGITDDAELLARSKLGHALMFFARGFPVIYYGDEQGFVSDGGDADAREDMLPSQVASYNDNNLIGTAATTADDNLDPNHPLYQTLADYATVYENNLALRRGAQIYRYSQPSAGLYVFSRIDRTEQVEYIVALNNAETIASAAFQVYSANAGFTAVYPLTSTSVITSDNSGNLAVTVPPLGVAIYRANAPLAQNRAVNGAPFPTFTTPATGEVLVGRVEVGVDLTETNRLLEVNFAVKIGDGEYQYLGTDNNAPYRIFYDVSGIPAGTAVTFQAIVNDLNGNYSNNVVTAVVGEETSATEQYAIIHYYRPAGDYGDYTSSDFNDFWGLHLWGSAIHPDEGTDWATPKKFSGFDSYGAYVAIRLQDPSQPVNFIIHKGNDKDTPDDRSFDPSVTPEIWLVQGDAGHYGSRAEAVGETLVHYNRLDGIYTDWGLHLWQDGSPSLTEWPTRAMPSSYDGFGAVYSITTAMYPTLEVTRGLNFIVHDGAGAQEPQRTYTPTINYEVWVNSAETDWYAEEGAAADFATIHYRRCLGDYGDFNSSDYNDFWGLHLWTGALTATNWTEPLKPIGEDGFGLVYTIPLQVDATSLSYILHRGDTKDLPNDQSLELGSTGYEIWIVEGDNGNNTLSAGVQFTSPAIAFSVSDRVCAGVTIGNIDRQRAYWLSENIIGWEPINPATAVYLHSAPTGGLLLGDTGISGGTVYTLTQNGVITGSIANKFPHLRGLPAWEIDAADLADVPDILKGQIAVSAFDGNGGLVDATGLQIPGVLDDLYTYNGDLGITWDNGITPTLRIWAPTAKNVTLHLFADAISSTTSITYAMTLDANYGVWSITGAPDWEYQYYLYEVEVYVHSTGEVEHNIVTDPYAVSLSMNSTRSQIVDLADPALMPDGWLDLEKPPLAAPEDITVYELHVRDFSINDPSVAAEDQGTFNAFTYDNSYGMQHLQALADAGLSHIHLLPVFDIATINEDKSQWAEPAIDPNAGPASDQQQGAVTAVADEDGFNWGYDPFHYSVPEGSYSTDPNGPTRIIEFREMIQALNERGLRVVMDVVYNHTNASGQNPNSVLDKIVPGYYHRLDNTGLVEHSTCCENTASEHNMMEKLMIDSLTMWATAYKVDAFRFDLMGHHMVTNMVNIRTALDSLTIANNGVDGEEIYLYGEGWNFGEVANNARGINATQANMAGTGIGTFSDRLRDAVRGGGPFDSDEALKTQGFANGLYYDPNNYTPPFDPLAQLLQYSDWVRAGLAGNLADYAFVTANDVYTTAAHIDYNGQPAGYTADPQEQIVYISK
ncbi:MAG: pullulanase-type alpha-1,6-glucosidase, partial [Anaerolineales bacterium]|nr:pullulanase-type alpha-1,6-glucosidase [Anaerolineales bacterium]